MQAKPQSQTAYKYSYSDTTSARSCSGPESSLIILDTVSLQRVERVGVGAPFEWSGDGCPSWSGCRSRFSSEVRHFYQPLQNVIILTCTRLVSCWEETFTSHNVMLSSESA